VSKGGISSSRIQSYGLLILIYIITIFLVASETVNLFQHESEGSPVKMLTWGGMLLAHHLALLGINKNSKAEPKHSEMPDETKSGGDNPSTKKLLNE